jgi:hypothetical protein
VQSRSNASMSALDCREPQPTMPCGFLPVENSRSKCAHFLVPLAQTPKRRLAPGRIVALKAWLILLNVAAMPVTVCIMFCPLLTRYISRATPYAVAHIRAGNHSDRMAVGRAAQDSGARSRMVSKISIAYFSNADRCRHRNPNQPQNKVSTRDLPLLRTRRTCWRL